ncbi:ROK family transcriptional regulator [Bosea sp. BK604]|uniref:ROK family transcriptional regulator n=1 Tax=Bosea sp. BK604 TaxID=2512180 RepID=UPI00104BE274|nr:ROK family transcriptional regulator [Bosea sp. BK604]TCR67536.1 putative NBD/HSP70 family sugar kinase [Bosea sp. BK604]
MKLLGANMDHAKRFNRRVVLETIRLQAPLSRAEITRATGLAPQTISNIIAELSEAGLVRNVNRRSGARGQPAVELDLNPDGGFTFGISFSHGVLLVILTDVAGTVRDRVKLELPSGAPEAVLDEIARTTAEMLTRQNVARRRVWGVGLVIPAILEDDRLVALGETTLPGWKDLPLRQSLQNKLELPVLLENDATAAAIGERLYGAGKSLTDFAYIYVGAGIGGGLFLRGQPYRGGYGKSGEIGHLVVDTGGRPCPCGNRGCLERYASVALALRALDEGRGDAIRHDDLDRISRALADGDPRLSVWLDEAAASLRQAIVMIENMLDPQAVVLGGVLPQPVLAALIKRILPLPRSVSSNNAEIPRIIAAEMGPDTPALGAATLPIFDGMSPELSLLFKQDVVEPL